MVLFGFLKRQKILYKKMNENLYQLKQSFLQEWPLSRIQNMTLEEYTNLEKTSFCYWLEALTTDIGSIWGGSAYKFGIYKRRETSNTITVDNRITDGDYAWFKKYGDSKDTAFQTVKNIILSIIVSTQNNSLETIDNIDLGDAYKWKIAFLYGNFNVVNIFNNESLFEAALSLGFKRNTKIYSELNNYILLKKPIQQEYFDFTHELWQRTSLANLTKYWIYAPGENAIKWEEFYKEGIMGLGWDEIGDLDQYKDKKEIKIKLQKLENIESTKQNDTAANYEFHKVIKIGDVIIVKKGIHELLGFGIVTSDYYFDYDKSTFQKCRKVNWKLKGNWKVPFNLPLKTLTDISKYPTEDPKYSKYFERLLAIMEGKDNDNQTISMNESIQKTRLNTILYGPPGTGKTYKLQNDFFDKFSIFESSLNKNQFLENLAQELSWWQIISISVYDLKSSNVNKIFEHELIKAKEKISDSKTIRPTIWGQLQRHTILSCPYVNVKDRSEPLYFNKDKDSNWTIDNDLLKLYFPEGIEILNSIKNYVGNKGRLIKNYEFITFHQSFSYEDFIEGIKPKLEEGESDLQFEIKDGVFKKLCLKAESDPKNNYAIFIDEINRGNVSAIFGELITLIEEDKRIGKPNELKVKLPYSKKDFGVPSNIFIIGTMNTADRSVEALDTALRRRFSFIEMMPNEEAFNNLTFNDSYPRKEIMLKINQRIEVLLDRNYTLGHSYFIKEDFLKSFENEIIPLLQEYFYNYYGKIGLVLGRGFVREKAITSKNDKSIFADFDTKNDVDIIKVYELIPFSEINFSEAIDTLLV